MGRGLRQGLNFVALPGLELAMETRVASNSQKLAYLYFPGAKSKDEHLSGPVGFPSFTEWLKFFTPRLLRFNNTI